MICGQCGAKNSDWRAFCAQCGRSLGRQCRCSYANEPSAKFCGGCGQKLDAGESEQNSRSALLVNQLSTKQIKDIMDESLLIKFEKRSKINQQDINEYFEDL